jgi:hypothetical protein
MPSNGSYGEAMGPGVWITNFCIPLPTGQGTRVQPFTSHAAWPLGHQAGAHAHPITPQLTDVSLDDLDPCLLRDQRTWVPPTVTTLPISATALGNAYNFDGQSFAYSLRPNPEPQPRPPHAVDRSPAIDASPRRNSKATAVLQSAARTWVPPAITVLPISATAMYTGSSSDSQWPVSAYGGSAPLEPEPRPPHRVDRTQAMDALASAPADSKAVAALDRRAWVPPAVTTLPISATAITAGFSQDSIAGMPTTTIIAPRPPAKAPRTSEEHPPIQHPGAQAHSITPQRTDVSLDDVYGCLLRGSVEVGAA